MIVVRDNIPTLQGLVLSHNSLRLANIKVVVGTLGKCHISGLNLEHNGIENVKDLINTLSAFPLIELKLEGNNCLRDIKDPVTYIKTVRAKLGILKTLDGVDIATYLSSKESTSALAGAACSTPVNPSTPTVTETLVRAFLEQFYTCLDSAHRLELVNAYIPTAKFAIQSEVPIVPAGECQSLDGIKQALTVLPLTKHANHSFAFEMVKCDPSEFQIKVSGRVHVLERECSFVHAFSIVPYNTGLGCSLSVLGYR